MVHDLSPQSAHRVRSALGLLRPYDLEGAQKVRIGRQFDGGYVMVERFEGVAAAYSLGINDDTSWDMDVALRGIPVFQYDHTIERLPEQHPLFHWEPREIGGVTDLSRNVHGLEDLVRENGHSTCRDLLLKCDIEGAEWPVLQSVSNACLAQFRQIVLEMHSLSFLTDRHHGENVRRALANLTASHRVVHVHANNHASLNVIGGYPVPDVIELTLVRHDQGRFAHTALAFPTALDLPCNPALADIQLGQFVFA